VDPQISKECTARYDESSVKAKITWFGEIVFWLESGDAVKALVIVFRQIRQSGMGNTRLLVSNRRSTLSDLISCCGLFPNTPTGQQWLRSMPSK
jgi:hypothetical protein